MKKNKVAEETRILRKAYARGGMKLLLEQFLDFFLMQFIAIGYTYKIDLAKIQYMPQSRELTFEKMTIHHLNEIYRNYKAEVTEQVYKDLRWKLENPEFEGFILKKEDEICNYSFIKYGTTFPILENKYVDEKKNGYLLTDYVFKRFRGSKIQQYDILMRLMVLKEKKFKTATGVVERYNYPSRSSIEKFGFEKCVIGFHLTFGKKKISSDYFKVINKGKFN